MTLVGCSDASGTIQGGEPIFDGGQPQPVSEASAPNTCQTGGTNAGSRWQDLFACYFGPSGVANCGQSGCHAVGGQNVWECGADKDTCWHGITTATVAGFAALVPTGTTDFTATTLYAALRKKPNDAAPANMPLSPANVVFTADDLMRMSDWIKAGAPNN